MTELYKQDDAASWEDWTTKNPEPTGRDENLRWAARYYNKIGANGGKIPAEVALFNPYVHVWIGGDASDTINPPRYGCHAEATYQKYGTLTPTDEEINTGGYIGTAGPNATVNGFYPPEGWEAFRLKHDPLLANPVYPTQAPASFPFPAAERPAPSNVTVVESKAEAPPYYATETFFPLEQPKRSLWDRIVDFFKALFGKS